MLTEQDAQRPHAPDAAVPARERRRFATLAGELTEAPDDGEAYAVRYRSLLALERRRPVWTFAITGVCMAFEAAFVFWLLQADHFPTLDRSPLLNAANVFVAASIAFIELLRMVNVISLVVASVTVRNPIPVRAQSDLRVAFTTTIVPSKEPLEVARRTLEAARAIIYSGKVDLWLLDEGDDPAVRAMCEELGVRHFTRKGVERWNQPSGPFKAKTKHGNYNAWLDARGGDYDILASVDPDHAPMPIYLERILGYFRDPDVAFVVGPQNYANCDNLVAKGAESQQFPFHGVIQRAANRENCAMLVGTNNAFRISALAAIGGLRDSVTEDMATGLYFHSSRNPLSGRRWKSVYTPDVLAYGEGPATWTDYFSQQLRWSRGTFEVLRHDVWRRLWRLRFGQMLHYGLILSFYPLMAIGWILGALNALLFLGFGASGIHVPVGVWLALYVDATTLQFLLYAWNRRYNVSPHEVEGSFGLVGMLMSVLAAPLYASALISTVLKRPARFIVTPKGKSSNADCLMTFRRQLQWAVLLGGGLLTAFSLHHVDPLVVFWPVLALTICLAPVAIWLVGQRPAPAGRLVSAAVGRLSQRAALSVSQRAVPALGGAHSGSVATFSVTTFPALSVVHSASATTFPARLERRREIGHSPGLERRRAAA